MKAKEERTHFQQRVGHYINSKRQRVILQLRKPLDELDKDHDHEASEQGKMSASYAQILLQETVEAEKIHKEKW